MAEQRLRVMSYNVGGHGARWSRRHVERLAAAISEAAPDVVGLQEVHRGTRHSRLEDQAEELARLTGMAVHFGKSFDMGGGEFGNAVLTRGEVRSASIHPLPGPGEPRTLLHTRLGPRRVRAPLLRHPPRRLGAVGENGTKCANWRSRRAAQAV